MGNDDMIKLSQEIKQINRNLQEGNIKKNKLADKYAKIIQWLKKECQLLNNNDKRQLEDFLRKQEEQKQKIKYEKQIKEGAKQMELYSKLMALQKRRQKRKEKKMYYESDSGSSISTAYYNSAADDVYEKRKRKRGNSSRRRGDDVDGAADQNDYEDDHWSEDHNCQSEESEVDEKPKKKKKKKGISMYIKN